MPLTNRTLAKARLVALMADMATRTVASPQDREDYADELIDTVADLMETAAAGWSITTVGSAATQTGRITNPTIS
ncbi:MAG: hypothetical protein V4621_08120 [Pseudomonadota bacterium]